MKINFKVGKIRRYQPQALAAVVLICATFIISTLGQWIPHASAATNWALVNSNTSKYSLYTGLVDCINRSDTTFLKSVITGSGDALVYNDVNGTTTTSGSTSAGVTYGLMKIGKADAAVVVGVTTQHYFGTDGQDGALQCKYLPDAFADEMGTRAGLLQTLGYIYVSAPGQGQLPHWAYTGTLDGSGNPSKAALVSKINSYMDTANVPRTLDEFMTYQLYYSAFTQTPTACHFGSFNPATTGTVSKFYNIGSATYASFSYSGQRDDTFYYKILPGQNPTDLGLNCSSVRTKVESLSVSLASTVAKQDASAATGAAAQIYADGTAASNGQGICSSVKSTRVDATDYQNCIAAIKSCLQTVSITIGGDTETYTYQNMPVDRFASCVYSKIKDFVAINQADIIPLYNALQPEAVKAGDGNITQADPCAAGALNDANGKPCNQTIKDPCASIPGNTPMPWLACSIFTAVKGMTDAMSGLMENILKTDTTAFFSTGLRKTSNVFRNLALTLIVIAGLIMVVAQATGTDIIDAYTVKKVLPKLGVAVVGIALSWPLLKFAVGLSNDLGGIVTNLFMGIANAGNLSTTTSNGFDNFGAILATAAAGGAVVGAIGFWGAILLVISLMISYVTGLIVLLMQKLLLVVLVVAAPLAIASYVLPGTEKFWKLWKSNFFKVIIMYFVIMVIVRVGDVLAALVLQGGIGGDGATLLAVLAKVATLVLTFKAPQFAGQILGGIIGAASGVAYKMAGAAKAPVDKLRQANTKQRNQQILGGTRFNETGMLGGIGRRLNTVGRSAGNVNKVGLNPLQMASRLRTAMDDQAHDAASEFGEKDAAFAAIKGDDDKLWAAKNTTRTSIENALKERSAERFGVGKEKERADAANQILRAQEATNLQTFQRARVRAQAKTGTGYHEKDENGNTVFNAGLMVEDINNAYGGDRAGAERALAEMRSNLTNSGQIAGQAGFGAWKGALDKNYYSKDAYTAADAHNDIMDDTINSVNPGNAVYGKPTSAAAVGAAHARRIQAIADGIADGTRTQGDLDAATSAAAGILDAMNSAAPQNASAFANELMNVTIEGTKQKIVTSTPAIPAADGSVLIAGTQTETETGDLTVRQLIESRMNNKEYAARRKDYAASTLREADAVHAAQAAAGARAPGPGFQGGPPVSGPQN